jgi:hypothetical protein
MGMIVPNHLAIDREGLLIRSFSLLNLAAILDYQASDHTGSAAHYGFMKEFIAFFLR